MLANITLFVMTNLAELIKNLDNEEKTNATRSKILVFVEYPVGYKIELIERNI